ncbi:four helix bundle protein [Candidatus Kuenenbacteria bacterium RIFCSPLOWO2_02_FULL_42_16]|nr:MAG: four helix bundle protein [Candidatus Kuenenbacteria bacterium RIFCSPLOWO2_02_FULL_42_16]
MQYDLEERCSVFAENVVVLCKKIKLNDLNKSIIIQLIRSATSIGANYMEANGASSKKDFKNKIFICLKEARETKHWLRLLARLEEEHIRQCRILWQEVHELCLIFGKISSSC